MPKTTQTGGIAILNLMGMAALILALVTGSAIAAITELKKIELGGSFDQTYYAAEAGLNEGLYQLRSDTRPKAFQFLFEEKNVEVVISGHPTNHDYRVVTARATSVRGNIRTLEVTVDTKIFGNNFDFAIVNGAGRVRLDNNSKIIGDVYSNSDIVPEASGTGVEIIGDVWISGNNRVEGVKIINGDVQADRITNLQVDGNAYYNFSSGSNYVTGSVYTPLNPLPPVRELPITETDINNWKADITDTGSVVYPNPTACPLGTPAGTYCVMTDTTLGWQKIEGNLYLQDGITVTMVGNLWVTGNLTLTNGGTLQLDASYGTSGGVLVVDGQLEMSNNYNVSGSGQAGSYILFASTNNSLDENTPAIYASNNSSSVIFAAVKGLLKVKNNGTLRAAASYALLLEPNANITYDPLLSSFVVRERYPHVMKTIAESWREL